MVIIRVSSCFSTHEDCWYQEEACFTVCPIPSNPSCHPHSHTLENTCVRSIPEHHRPLCAHCEELGIARVNPLGEATAKSSQHCWALGEEQSNPEDHKILTAACLCSEFAYKEMSGGPLLLPASLQGKASRSGHRSLSTLGPIPCAPAKELSWGSRAEAGRSAPAGRGKLSLDSAPGATRHGQGSDLVTSPQGDVQGTEGTLRLLSPVFCSWK